MTKLVNWCLIARKGCIPISQDGSIAEHGWHFFVCSSQKKQQVAKLAGLFHVCNRHHRITYTITGQSQVLVTVSQISWLLASIFIILSTALFFARWPLSFEFSDMLTFIKCGYLTQCAIQYLHHYMNCDIVVFISILVLACEVFFRQNLQLVHTDVHEGV